MIKDRYIDMNTFHRTFTLEVSMKTLLKVLKQDSTTQTIIGRS